MEDTNSQYILGPRQCVSAIQKAIETLKQHKPKDGSDKDKRYSIVLTSLYDALNSCIAFEIEE